MKDNGVTCVAKYYSGDGIEEKEMGGNCGLCGEKAIAWRHFW